MEDIKYRFSLTGVAGTIPVTPQNNNQLTIVWEKENNSAHFRKKLNGKIKLVGSDFKFIYFQERSIYRCTPLSFLIERNCNGFSDYFTATFYCNNGIWDIDHCEVEISASTDDLYTCYDIGKDSEINLFSYVDSEVSVETVKGTIETTQCDNYGYPEVDWCEYSDPYSLGWEILAYDATQDADDGTHHPPWIDSKVTWIRETISVFGSLPAPWIFISTDGTINLYARPPVLYNRVYNPTNERQIKYRYEYGATFGNGMRFYNVMHQLLHNICPDLIIISDFFQWNPIVESDINYQTGELSKVKNIIVFQKSDVKRPSNDDATDATTSFDEILQDVCTIFKLQWWIQEDDRQSKIHASLNELTSPEFIDGGLQLKINGVIPAGGDMVGTGSADFTEDAFQTFSFEAHVDSTPVGATNPRIIMTIVKDGITVYQNEAPALAGASLIYAGILQPGSVYLPSVQTTDNADVITIINIADSVVINTLFRIEHPSYFNNVLGIDLTTGREDDNIRAGKASYQYVTDGMPIKEIFTWMDKSNFGDFKGNDIVYTNVCGVGNSGNDKTHSVENITTDIQLCLDNPDADSDVVDDEGFVLIACDEDDFLLYEASILGGNTLNNTLAWAQLQRDYWRYNTYFYNFILNTVNDTSQKVIPTKKQTGVILKLCCGDVFDPEKLIKTVIDTGIIDTASLNLYSDMLTVDVLFDDGDLIENDPPIVVDDYANIPVNSAIIIDVLANDSDPDGTIDPARLAITGGPSYGSAVITVDFKVLYTPDMDYEGSDSFSYTVKDNLGAQSNPALVIIDVIQPAVAVDDNYKTAINKELNNDELNILANDSGTLPLSAVPETKATGHGTVQIFAGGTFDYTPEPGYLGDDTFDYTLIDVNSSEDVGTVTINVFNPVPVFVKLVESNVITADVIDICTHGPTVTGSKTNKDYTAYFYSDMAGTVPLDVTGYGTFVNSNIHTVSSFSGISDTAGVPKLLNGFSVVLVSGLATDFLDNGCSGTDGYHVTQTFTVTPTADYTII